MLIVDFVVHYFVAMLVRMWSCTLGKSATTGVMLVSLIWLRSDGWVLLLLFYEKMIQMASHTSTGFLMELNSYDVLLIM